jgi:hypothetical protein
VSRVIVFNEKLEFPPFTNSLFVGSELSVVGNGHRMHSVQLVPFDQDRIA